MYWQPLISKGPIQVLRNAVGGGMVSDILGKKRYEDVQLNLISITKGWVSNFQKFFFT